MSCPTLRQQRPPKERKWQTRADRWDRSGREELPQCHHTQHGRESCEYSIQAGDCVGGSGILWVLLLLFSSPPADAPRGEAPDPLTQQVRGSLSHQSPPAFLSRGVRATPKFLFENHSCVQCCLCQNAASPSFMSLQGSVWILGNPTKPKAGTGAPWTISVSSYNTHWTGEAAKAQTWQVNGRDKSQARGCLSTVFHQLIPTRKKLFQKVHSIRTFPLKKNSEYLFCHLKDIFLSVRT